MSRGKGTKMSLADFVGGEPVGGIDHLPTGPRARGPDDDGSFQRRRPQRRENGDDYQPSRAEADTSWRRGGGPPAGDGGFRGSAAGGGGYRNDRGGYNDRSGGGYNDRGGFDRRSGGFDSRGGGFDDRGRGGFDDRGRGRGFDSRGGGFDDRGRLDTRGGGVPDWGRGFDSRGGGFEDRGRGVDRGTTGPPSGERPRLQLKQRTVEANKERTPASSQPETTNKPKANPFGGASAVDTASKLAWGKPAASSAEPPKSDESPPPLTQETNESTQDDNNNNNKDDKKQPDNAQKRREPEVINSRAAAFEAAPAAKREQNNRRDQNDTRGPPPILNKRVGQLADEEKDRVRDRNMGPPPVAKSRFAAAAEADRSYDRRGPPPPTVNSRFAAAAEADRSTYQDRGPPPVATSRFAAAAEADRSSRSPPRDERGPPPMANSRFAAAAAQAERENQEREERRREREHFYGRDETNYGRHGRDRDENFPAGGRFGGGRDSYQQRHDNRLEDRGFDERPPVRINSKDDNVLKATPKVAPEHEANILKVPTKEHADNILVPPKKTKPEAESAPEEEPEDTAPETTPAAPSVDQDKLLEDFVNGGKLGDELKSWCEANKASLPTVDKLVFHLLNETEKLNPDPECKWADPAKYGAALQSLVEDNTLAQMQVLWGIQLYCDKIGFPKLNDEYVVQGMFRSMYKYDLADDDAFAEWKEDVSDEHEAGKMKAVIQTVEWFNWLEEDEDDDDEEGYEEE